jgi:hypothetical protein
MEEIGRGFVEAFNRRDADGLVALCDPGVEFHPTLLVGARRVYRGHEGLRAWIAELDEGGSTHQVRVREVRILGENRFAVLSEVCLGEEFITHSAMLGRLAPGDESRIIRAEAYLSDEQTLAGLGLLDPD